MQSSSKNTRDPLFVDVVEDECSPLLFKGAVTDWPALKWTPRYLSDTVGDRRFRCKITERLESELCPETECLYMNCSLSEYCDWLSGICDDDNPLKSLSPQSYACYIDYKYMKEMFVNSPHLLQEVQWDSFGFYGRDGNDSTIWIGSSGAYTPCHQDTYGFNLVTQIYGKKRWLLFPPSQTSWMYPTRIPYEESSVFCEVNLLKPDLKKHNLFKYTTPYVIDLYPGDVLYVPRHWWHFVQCIESSISVNTWIPVDADQQSHVHESITKFLMSTIVTALPDLDISTYLNPNEGLPSVDTSLKFIEMAVDTFKNETSKQTKHCGEIDKAYAHNSNVSGSVTKNSIQNPCEKDKDCNFMKFVGAFKDFEVQYLCKDCHGQLSPSTFTSLNEEVEPPRKRGKVCHHGISQSPTIDRINIYRVNSVTFDEYLSIYCVPDLNDEGEPVQELEEIPGVNANDEDEHSNNSSSMQFAAQSIQKCGNSKQFLKCGNSEQFLYDIIDAVLKPNVIEQIAKNLSNKIS